MRVYWYRGIYLSVHTHMDICAQVHMHMHTQSRCVTQDNLELGELQPQAIRAGVTVCVTVLRLLKYFTFHSWGGAVLTNLLPT